MTNDGRFTQTWRKNLERQKCVKKQGILKKWIGTRKVLIIIRNRQLKFWWHILWKESLENLTLTGTLMVKEAVRKQKKTWLCLTNPSKSMTEHGPKKAKSRVQELLRAKKKKRQKVVERSCLSTNKLSAFGTKKKNRETLFVSPIR